MASGAFSRLRSHLPRAETLRQYIIICLSICVFAASDALAEPDSTEVPLVGIDPTPALPESVAILAMVRSTLVAVDQGNKTGNYTVLRDLGSPSFRDTNNASRLALIFSSLVTKGVDLLPVTVVEPDYGTPPSITSAKMLYVNGTYPIVPKPLKFEILFQMYQGRWRLFGISIEPISVR